MISRAEKEIREGRGGREEGGVRSRDREIEGGAPPPTVGMGGGLPVGEVQFTPDSQRDRSEQRELEAAGG